MRGRSSIVSGAFAWRSGNPPRQARSCELAALIRLDVGLFRAQRDEAASVTEPASGASLDWLRRNSTFILPILPILQRSLITNTDDPEYKKLIEITLPAATQMKLKVFEQYQVEALVFPYLSSFAPPISNPAFKLEDPSFVKSDKPQPAILSGYSSVGFPCLVVPMGFGSQGLPMDIVFFGKPYEESKLIGFGYAYEQASLKRKPSPLLPPLAGEVV